MKKMIIITEGKQMRKTGQRWISALLTVILFCTLCCLPTNAANTSYVDDSAAFRVSCTVNGDTARLLLVY